MRLKKLHHLALLWLICIPAFASDNIAGMWSSQSRTKGGLGSQWVLSKDGVAAYTFGALVDFKYEVTGSRITMTLLDSRQVATKEVLVDEFKIEGDTLTTNPNDPNKKQMMKRVGRQYPGPDPIVGEWTYQHSAGAPAYMRYSQAGVAQLSVPFQSLLGKYRVSKDVITFELPGKSPINYKFHHENMFLILTDSGGKDSRFTRFDY